MRVCMYVCVPILCLMVGLAGFPVGWWCSVHVLIPAALPAGPVVFQIHEGLERAKRLLKNSKKRDYYKILGVPRNARKKDIVKVGRARAMAQEHRRVGERGGRQRQTDRQT